MIIVGALLAVVSLGVAAAAEQTDIAIGDPALFGWLAIFGAALFVAGLLYVAIRQLRVRRHLPPGRYRGPAIPLLLVLVFVLASIATAPFARDAAALVLGQGKLTFFGSIVILMATQSALLLVSWFLVFRPGALQALPSLPGRNAGAALLQGVGWGVVAWIVSSMIAVGVELALRQAGLEMEPQAAEQAISVVEPWVVVLAIVVLAPIAEEIFFRGIVFNAWLRERGRRWAFIGSAALFAIIHVSLVALLPIFVLGLGLAWIYSRTGNLLAPIAMHATVNGISVILALLVRFEVITLPV
ncbi:MAG: CPBP family intramembrane glutamic endopeptidase [Candidatus Limnocylindria bacterium]